MLKELLFVKETWQEELIKLLRGFNDEIYKIKEDIRKLKIQANKHKCLHRRNCLKEE